ncbi:MAG: hypothetical protein U9P80_06885, partial [Thermodesulfobacteriota bacterium]|nr:hypothetical protein [Thermodesulfobacteriota bacterium]
DIDPFSIPAHSGLAEIYIRHKRYNDAICHLKSLWDIQGDRQSLEQLVILDLREKRYTETIDLIHSLDTLGKDDRYYLAMAYAGLKQWDNALGILEELGNGCKIVLLKASILEDMGRREDAIGMLEAAWQTNKVNNGCNDLGYQMCMVMERANRQKDALVHSLDMLRDRPNDPVLLNFTGYVWAEMGVNLDQAHTMIAKALKIKPNDAYILDSMAWVLYRQDRSEEALVYMKKALSGIDDDPVMNEHMGDILLDTGKDKDAFAYYLKARILSDRIFSGKDKASLDSKIDILFEGLKQK